MGESWLRCGWPYLNVNVYHPLWRFNSRLCILLVGGLSKIWLEYLNTLKLVNMETLEDVIRNRRKGQPLITMWNHYSCLDDPMLFGSLKLRTLCNQALMRWSIGAEEIMFTQRLHCWFFSHGKIVPIIRGHGVYQTAMDFCIERLNRGEWVHIFPEGKVNEKKEIMRLKWGIGRLVAESNVTPLVLPIWHHGMDDILPNKTPYIPQIGKRVTLLVGKPIDLTDLVATLKRDNKSPREMRKEVTDVIQKEFYSLKSKTEQIHFSTSV